MSSEAKFYIELYKGKGYSSFEEMGKEVYLYPGRFYVFFQSKPFLRLLYQDKKRYSEYLSLLEEKDIPDVFLFRMSYILNPYMSLRYHHFLFRSYKELGEQMLFYGPTVDVYLKDLLVYHLLSAYMEKVGDTKRYMSIYASVKECEKEAADRENVAYWKLAFALAGTKEIVYRHTSYSSPKEFFNDHLVLSSLIELSEHLEESEYVLAWLEMNGFDFKLSTYRGLVQSEEKQEEAARELEKALSLRSEHKENGK
jgi:hypothetical protein